MKKVIFCTNIPSPYRVDFFNALGKLVKLTVLYERHTSLERNAAWQGSEAESYEEIYLRLKPKGTDQSYGSALRKYISSHNCDFLILSNYVSPATMETIVYCRFAGIPYYIEYDGGFNKKDPFITGIVKRFLLRGAKGHLTTCEEHIAYLKSIGISETKIHKYPFTSVRENDIYELNTFSKDIQRELRAKLGMTEIHIILSVGMFSYEAGYGNGYDVLLDLAESAGSDYGFYVVGDEPTDEFVKMKEYRNISNVHYVGFSTKDDLSEYYIAADLFILLSRSDACGLVINEAMSFGLPIILSEKCIAGLELVKDGENGFVVGLDDVELITKRVISIVDDNNTCLKMGYKSLEFIKEYIIEQKYTTHKNLMGGKKYIKKLLNISDEKVILTIGQFVHRKGIDILMKACQGLNNNVGVYIVGGKPTDEYLALQNDLGLTNVHFIDFMVKKDLANYYKAADLFVFPTREDIWGLVINEAMSFGLPIISSDRCIAAQEMIDENLNGHLVKSDNVESLKECINRTIAEDYNLVRMGYNSLQKAKQFTIEKMVEKHSIIFNGK